MDVQTDKMNYRVASLLKRLRLQSAELLVLIIVVYFSNDTVNTLCTIEHGRTDRHDEI